ncbi:MAG: leucine-rich repeat domain-containing protein [Candidatus Limisoma sp.]
MRYITLLIVIVASALTRLYAVDVTAGGVEAALKDSSPETMTSLTLSGTIDARDIAYIANSMPQLTSIDLSATSIARYSSTEALFANYVTFAANELPPCCFAGKAYTSVALPGTLTSIGDGAFTGCPALAQIDIPASVTRIGDFAFASMPALTTVTGAAGVQTIGSYAFNRSINLSAMPFTGVKAIGAYAFQGCERLSNPSFGSSVEQIGEGAFKASGITTADLSSTRISAIGAWAFADTEGLTTVKLPATIESLGDGAFFYSTSLNKVEMPQGLTTINDFVFGNVTTMTEMDPLPESVKRIGDYAFTDWTDIVEFSIPTTIEHIGTSAFRNWTALRYFNARPAVPPTLGETVWEGIDQSTVVLKVDKLSENLYKAAEQWRDFQVSNTSEVSALESAVKVTFSGDVLRASATEQIATATVYDLSGIVLSTKSPAAMSVEFNLGAYSAKVYVLRCALASGKVEYIKFGTK